MKILISLQFDEDWMVCWWLTVRLFCWLMDENSQNTICRGVLVSQHLEDLHGFVRVKRVSCEMGQVKELHLNRSDFWQECISSTPREILAFPPAWMCESLLLILFSFSLEPSLLWDDQNETNVFRSTNDRGIPVRESKDLRSLCAMSSARSKNISSFVRS